MKGEMSVKKDRDCGGMAYPVYPQMVPNFGGMVMPGQMIPMPNMNMGMSTGMNAGMVPASPTMNNNMMGANPMMSPMMGTSRVAQLIYNIQATTSELTMELSKYGIR